MHGTYRAKVIRYAGCNHVSVFHAPDAVAEWLPVCGGVGKAAALAMLKELGNADARHVERSCLQPNSKQS